MEGLVLKWKRPEGLETRRAEAPRGGAGIEISVSIQRSPLDMKPLVEGLVLKLQILLLSWFDTEAPRGGAGIEIARAAQTQP